MELLAFSGMILIRLIHNVCHSSGIFSIVSGLRGTFSARQTVKVRVIVRKVCHSERISGIVSGLCGILSARQTVRVKLYSCCFIVVKRNYENHS